MLVLATDTSGRFGSVALARCGPEKICNVLEVVPLEGGTFSAQLIPQIAALLAKHGFQKQDLGLFCVASGPGSFTGLRVGLAAIKGLAEILGKPIVSVSLLRAVAHSAVFVVGCATQQAAEQSQSFSYIAALDAGRKEAYAVTCKFAVEAGHVSWNLTFSEESLMGWNFLANLLIAGDVNWIATPDPALHAFLETAKAQPCSRTSGLFLIPRPNSADIACYGWRKYLKEQTINVDQLDANYIRRSDAEIFSQK